MSSSNFEIERKFLIHPNSKKDWIPLATKHHNIKQVYICKENGWLTRLRIYDDFKAEITLKGPRNEMLGGCPEYNLFMPIDQAKELWNQTEGHWRIEKTRHLIPLDNGLFLEMDEFKGKHEGLFLAEVELPSLETKINLPDWILQEVTGNVAFDNIVMAELASSKEDNISSMYYRPVDLVEP